MDSGMSATRKVLDSVTLYALGMGMLVIPFVIAKLTVVIRNWLPASVSRFSMEFALAQPVHYYASVVASVTLGLVSTVRTLPDDT
jgi:hypothetical protein